MKKTRYICSKHFKMLFKNQWPVTLWPMSPISAVHLWFTTAILWDYYLPLRWDRIVFHYLELNNGWLTMVLFRSRIIVLSTFYPNMQSIIKSRVTSMTPRDMVIAVCVLATWIFPSTVVHGPEVYCWYSWIHLKIKKNKSQSKSRRL